MFSMLVWYKGSLNWKTCLQRQQCPVIQSINWLSKSSKTQHLKLVALRRIRSICIWVHLSNSHTKIVVKETGFGYYIFVVILMYPYIRYQYQS